MKTYEEWLNSPFFDEATKNELAAIKGDEKEIEERFYKNLAFGTGGLRGILGAGTNRMNIYTVRKASQGLANYILSQGEEGKKMGVVIAHDSRRFSPEFALQTALIMIQNGIRAYLFDSLRPTPVLSFAVRKLGCIAGVVITASHNPPEYNGYKAYWSDGGQIPYPRDEAIITEVDKITDFSKLIAADKEEALKSGMLTILPKEIDDEYIANVKAQSLNPKIIQSVADDFKIVYTPLHGTGNLPVRRVLAEVGFKHVHVVPEQELPDSEFTTVSYPNPEDPKAFTLAMKLADKIGADIVVATDPDADRVGAVIKDKSGEYIILSGNMSGVLITEYILSQKKAAGTLPANSAVVSTIVSTNMTKQIAKAYNTDYYEVLTGFKYIGEKIKEFEATGGNTYVFGFEESYGCLAGTYARDKDAVVATMLICEIAAYYKTRGMSMYDGLQELYKKYGYFKESIESITLKGKEGVENIKKIMTNLRSNPPKAISGIAVEEVRDYQNEIITTASGETRPSGLPVSDVLYYVLADGSWFCIRPSGTEPKIKIYFGVQGKTQEDAEAKLAGVTKSAMEAVNGANI